MMTDLQSIDHLGTGSEPRASMFVRMSSFFVRNVPLHVAVLILLSSFCFLRTLGTYFIADDFPEIAYVSSIFHGHPDRFFSNFTGNYMQVPGMKVYRPGMFLTMVLDFLCYGSKAWGYFLTNFLYFTGDIIALYFFCRVLAAKWPVFNSVMFALFSAALFAVNPLHCETISWMCGRGDPVSAFFYLLSLLLFVHSLSKPRPLMIGSSVAFFAIALSIKEMPVGLPVVTTVLAFFWIDAASLRKRAANAFRFSSPFWFTVVLYFLVRYFCLGTFGGGYVGGIGAQQLSAMLRHWTDVDTYQRILIPVTQELANQSVFSLSILRALNVVAFSLACIRLTSGCWSWRWAFFIFSLLLTTAAPIFQLWGIGPNLEGGRFYFYLSLPLSMMLPLALFHPREEESAIAVEFPINPGYYGLALTTFSLVILTGLVAVLGRTTSKTNMLWVHAGREDLELSKECQIVAAGTDKQKRILVLGVPDDYHGAHLILNRTMFDVMLRPPFILGDISSRFLTTVPIMYGPEQYVNGSRLKQLLSQPDVSGPYVWVRDKQKFQLIDLHISTRADDKTLTMPNSYSSRFVRKDHRSGEHYSVYLDNLDLDPLAIDAIEFDLNAIGLSEEPLKVFWKGAASFPAEAKDDFRAEHLIKKENGSRSVRVRLGHYWRWYACGRIKSLEIVFPDAEQYHLQNIRLLPAACVAPTLSFIGTDRYLTESQTSTIELSLSKAQVSGVSSMQLEIGKNNYFFDNFQGVDDQVPVAFKLPLPADSRSFAFENSSKYFPYPGYYQLRLRCLDQHGMPTGECSDPVTVFH
jgi:hypothetical protein